MDIQITRKAPLKVIAALTVFTLASPVSAIIGGNRPRGMEQFPSIVALAISFDGQMRPNGGCTGVKIAEYAFLTARHCVLLQGLQVRALGYAHTLSVAVGDYKWLTPRLVRPSETTDLAVVVVKEATPEVSTAALRFQPLGNNTLVATAGYGIATTEEFQDCLGSLGDSSKKPGTGREKALLKYIKTNLVTKVPADLQVFHYALFDGQKARGEATKATMGDSGGPSYWIDPREPEGPFNQVVGISSLVFAGRGGSSFQESLVVRIDQSEIWLREVMKEL